MPRRREPAAGRTPVVDVCHVSASLERGGLEMLLVDLVRHSDPAAVRHRFIALQTGGAPAELLTDLGCDVTLLDLGDAGRATLLRSLRHALKASPTDVVHSHNRLAGVYGGLAAASLQIGGRLNTEHGTGLATTPGERRHDRLRERLHRVLVGVSSATTDQLRRAGGGRARRHCIPNGVDLRRFSACPTPSGSAAEDRLISVGRLAPGKGQDTVIHALALARRTRAALRLDVVGDGPERQRLSDLAERLGLDDAVRFLGERDDVPELLRSAGLFVHASTAEGLPVALLEAMATSLPCIATATGGVTEALVDGITGQIVEPRPEPVAAAITDYADNLSRWRSWGRAGRDRVEAEYSIDTTAERYLELYRALAAHRPREADRTT